jgi:hypothetical protein
MGIKKKRIKLALKRARRQASLNPKKQTENSVILEQMEKEVIKESDVKVEKPVTAKKAAPKKSRPKPTASRKKRNSSK